MGQPFDPNLLALDVAILPPPEASDLAVRSSASLPADEFQGLRLDDDHLPHITLTQQFVPVAMLDEVLAAIAAALRGVPPIRVGVTGGSIGGSTVWMAVDRSAAIAALHERLMEALQRFEQPSGGPEAFADGDARPADTAWVAGYRLEASGPAFRPHITLGHASRAPHIEPFGFEASTVAVCHLGRFCTCRHVLRKWQLSA